MTESFTSSDIHSELLLSVHMASSLQLGQDQSRVRALGQLISPKNK